MKLYYYDAKRLMPLDNDGEEYVLLSDCNTVINLDIEELMDKIRYI